MSLPNIATGIPRGGRMASLPTGTVTFLFTDIEGSTALIQRLGDRRLPVHERNVLDNPSRG